MTPKKSPPSKAVAKSRLRVPSTRVDGSPGKALAVRAEQPMTTTYGTGSGTITVTVTHPIPHFTGTVTVLGTVVLPFTDGTATVTVPGYALGAIGAAGFEVTIGTQSPAPPYDANLDTLVSPIVSNTASSTAAALRAAFVAVGSVLINVKNYGAKGDYNGTTGTDDTAALQAALNAVPADGAILYVPAGRYLVPNGGLTCAHPVRIVGQLGLDGTGPRIDVTADAVTGLSLTSPASSVELLNIAHVLTGTRSASLVGLSITNANFSRLDGVRIEGFSTNAKVSGDYYSVINSNFRDFVAVGLDYSNSDAGDAGDGTIFNCTFDRGSDTVVGGTAVLWHSGGGMRFINNKINGKSAGGAYFTNGLLMTMDNSLQTGVMLIAGNSVENFTGMGFGITHNDTSSFQNTIVITGNEFSGLDAAAASTGCYIDEDTSGVVVTGNHFFTVQTGVFVDRIKHVAISGNSFSNIQQTGVHVGTNCKDVKIDPQPMDVIAGGSHVVFDKPGAVADPCWEVVIPFGGNNGSNMPVISDNTGHDQVEIDLIAGYNAVIVDIDVTGVVAGNGAWAARQQRLVAATNGGNATIQTIGTDFAYQGTGAVITQTAGTSKATFGVQKLSGTDLSGHMRIKVRGAALAGVKQLNRYN